MGFSGSFVLFRSATAAPGLAAITTRTQALEWDGRYADGWQVAQYPGSELFDDVMAFLAELADETGAPTLSAFVVDSDTVDVFGHPPTGDGYFRVCLVRDPMAGYLEDDGIDLDQVFPPPPVAAKLSATWAVEAGLTPDHDDLLRILTVEEVDLFAERLFFDYLHALGIRPASTSPGSG